MEPRVLLLFALFTVALIASAQSQGCPDNCLKACGDRDGICHNGHCVCYVSREANNFLKRQQRRSASVAKRQQLGMSGMGMGMGMNMFELCEDMFFDPYHKNEMWGR